MGRFPRREEEPAAKPEAKPEADADAKEAADKAKEIDAKEAADKAKEIDAKEAADKAKEIEALEAKFTRTTEKLAAERNAATRRADGLTAAHEQARSALEARLATQLRALRSIDAEGAVRQARTSRSAYHRTGRARRRRWPARRAAR